MDALRGIEAIAKDWLIDVGDGDVVATVGTTFNLRRDDGTPNQPGDVLSCQPDGTLQTRPAGASGNFERAITLGSFLVYRPVGERTFLLPLATDWPNR